MSESRFCLEHDWIGPSACPQCSTKEFRHVNDPLPPATPDDQRIYEQIAARHNQDRLPGGNSKDTNPKDAIGIRKLAFSVLPWQVMARVAVAMMEGAAKYGRHNYRAAGVRASVYFDAVVARHLTSWWEGNDIDPDSGLHEIDKALAGLMVMRDSMLQGNFIDDRPPKGKGVDLPELNRLTAEMQDRHKDKDPKHYTINDSL